jgi:CDP-diacylglycerol--glycerol-3-phosphate 3-phosphatidyltransferase
MQQLFKPLLDFIDRLISVPESKATYLTRITLIDKVIDKVVLWAIPYSVKPNHLTKFRLISIPFIAGLLIYGDGWVFGAGFVLFVVSALSDAIDGALARTRDQVTVWGTLYDPIADKLLIGTVSAIVVSNVFGPFLALTIVFLEVCLVASAYFRYKGKIVPAKTIGKTKMVLQCVGAGILLLSLVLGGASGVPILNTIALYTLYLAVAFALLSLFIFRSI